MRRAVFIAGCLALAACGRGREKEPNEDTASATALRPGRVQRGTISSPQDKDVYRLDVSRDSGVVSWKLSGIKDVDFVVTWSDKDGRPLKVFDETASGGEEEGTDLGVSRGVYFLTLANKQPRSNNPGQEYSLQLELENAAGRELEPNDSTLAAGPLPALGVLKGHYHPARNLLGPDGETQEEDWFKIAVDQTGLFSLNVDLSGVPGIDPILELYDGNGYKLREVDGSGPGQPEILRNFGVRGPMQLLMRLRGKARSANAAAPYEILTELIPYAGKTEFEPNDQRLDATPLSQDSVTGQISHAGDVDWYRIEAASGTRQLLSARLGALPGMDLELRLSDEFGAALLTIDNMGREAPETLTGLGLSGTTVYLTVSEKGRKLADERKFYTLERVLTTAIGGLEYEINDSSRTPQAIKVGESVDGYAAPKGDVDFYEFNVYQKSRISIETTGILNVRWSVTLFDQEYRELKSQTAGKAGEPALLELDLEPGTYALRLAPADPAQNNVRDKYTLRVRAR